LSLDDRTKRLLPWLVAIAFFMQTLDGSILNTALPAMARDLGESPLRMQSVVIAYLLTVALLIPASGWLADRFGTQRVFITAIVLFSLGSLLCALSRALPLLVAARVVQGIGGALLLPVGRLAILRGYPRAELMRALAFVAVPGLLGPLVGPTLGGWLVEVASWHWVFLINLPVGAIGLGVSLRYMPNLAGAAGRFDIRGFVLFSCGLVLVSLALQGLGERALSAAASLVMLVAGAASMIGYWLHAARAKRPLFSLALFRIPTFTIGLAGNLFSRLGSGAMPFLMPLYLQIALGKSPSVAGMSLIPTALGAMLCKAFAEPLIRRFGYRRVLVGNTLLVGTMIAGFALTGLATPHVVLLGMLAAFGIVNSLQYTAMNTLTLGDLDAASASGGNSLLSVVMQLSMSLGVAAGAALLIGFGGSGAARASEPVLRAFHATFVCVGLLSMMAALIFVQLGRAEAPGTKPGAALDPG
jgi:EmrB/QacA subfamily drug resistance transporter